jgi:hypothetical protein
MAGAARTVLHPAAFDMRISLPAHHFSVEPDDGWVPDPIEPGAEHLGLYLRSIEHGVYLNVREQDPGSHALTQEGLLEILREQTWGPKIDEWAVTAGPLVIVGGTFEAAGMGGEVVLEVFVTDGRRVANLAGPGSRQVIAKLRPAAEHLAGTIRFSPQ